MKRSVTFLIAALVVVLAVPAFAGVNTGTLTVQATVNKNCLVSSPTLNFGNYDPLAGTNLDAQTNFTVTCTKGATGVWLDLNTGSHAANATAPSTRAMASGTNYLSYELYTTNARNVVWGSGDPGAGGTGVTITFSAGAGLSNPATATVYGRIPSGQDAAVSPLATPYTDSVTATINF